VRQWGFQGFVQTDWIWGLRDAKKGALAGQQLEMPFQNQFHRFLPGLIKRGEVSAAVVEEAGLRILRQRVRFGSGRNPADYKPDVIGCEAHRNLAREAAGKSIVLLKNDGGMLPLRDITNLTVIGRLADTPNTGDGGSSSTQPAYVVTLLDGLRAAASTGYIIRYDEGRDPARAAAAAKFADVAICVVGYDHSDEGEFVPRESGPWNDHFPKAAPDEELFARRIAEARTAFPSTFAHDRSSLRLHPDDEVLIQTVAAANPRTVVAIMGGSAVVTESWRDKAAAILMLWYPGMEGGRAFADILLGRINPSGKLPCIFPKRAEDLPAFDNTAAKVTYDLWHGYRKLERDRALPAFPFGFGLSYTTFSLDKLRLAESRIGSKGTLAVTAELTNTGDRAGEEVVQLYVGARTSKVARAAKELKGFAKIALAPREKRLVRVAIPATDLAYYNEPEGWVVEPGEYEVILGRHSLDEKALRAQVIVN
jgi:beta-glucosidase